MNLCRLSSTRVLFRHGITQTNKVQVRGLSVERNRKLLKTFPVGFIAIALAKQTLSPDVAAYSVPISIVATYLALYTVNPVSRRLNELINLAIQRNKAALKIVGFAVFTIQTLILFTIVNEEIAHAVNLQKQKESVLDKRIMGQLEHWFSKSLYVTTKEDVAKKHLEMVDPSEMKEFFDSIRKSNFGSMIPEKDTKILVYNLEAYSSALTIAENIQLKSILQKSPVLTDQIRAEITSKVMAEIEQCNLVKSRETVFGYLEELIDPSVTYLAN